MKQVPLNLKLDINKTRKRELLAQMEKVVPWDDLVGIICPYYPEGKNGRPPSSLHSMLCIHFLQPWSSLSTGPCKRPSLKPRFTASSRSSKGSVACVMSPPSCALTKLQVHATSLKNTSWQSKSRAWSTTRSASVVCF